MTKLRLKSGDVCLIDDQDFDLISDYSWYPLRSSRSNTCYAQTIGLDKKKILMHNLIMGSLGVDHINGNGLDNRRENLRLATGSQNQANRGPLKNNTSGYKGVSWNKRAGKWEAVIRVNHRAIYLGIYVDKEEAAGAYDAAALEHYGEFAFLNFPERSRDQMPSGTRFTAKVKDTSFNISVKQFDALKKRSIKLAGSFKADQTGLSLAKHNLFVRRNGSLVRTKLGDELLSVLSTKIRKATKATKAVKESAK